MKTIHALAFTSLLLATASGLAQTNRVVYSSGTTRGAARSALRAVTSNAVPVVTTIRLQNQALPAVRAGRATAQAGGRVQPFSSSGPTCATPPGLAAWWSGNGNANDTLGYNPGILQGDVAFPGSMVGDGFSFNGTNQAVEIPYSSILATPSFSVEAWVFPYAQVDDPISQDLIFGQCYGRCQLVMRPGTDGLTVAFMFAGDPYTFYEVDSDGEIPIDDWTHLVGTWDGTTLSLYTNGQLNAQAEPGTVPWDSGCAFHIGGFYDPEGDCAYVGQFFNGMIDEASYYAVALSADGVQALFGAGQIGKCQDQPPCILIQPESQRVPEGTNASLSVGAIGMGSLSYQWQFNGSSLSDATQSTLALPSAQLSSSGTYSVVVSNFSGSVISESVVLTVYTPVCTPPAGGLVGWWAGEQDASDRLCANNGTLQGGAGFGTGMVGQAFSFDGINSYVNILKAASLDLGGQMTVEFWMKAEAGNLMQSVQGLVGSDFYSVCIGGGGDLGYGVDAVISTDAGASWATTAEVNGGGAVVSANRWHHIAGTYDGTSLQLYVDGQPAGNPILHSGSISPMTANSFVSIGSEDGRAYCPSCTANRYFRGLIDEPSIYNTALTAGQIRAIYEAGVAGKCYIPADWLAHWFGPNYQNEPYAGVTADADGDGVNNLQEYQNGNDPNKIVFQTSFTNDHVNANSVSGTIVLDRGVPAQMAILVNPGGSATTNWTAYSSTFTAALTATDGQYEVRVGLRGFASDSQQAWDRTVITRDTQPPLLTITNPIARAGSQPLIQVQGYGSEPLASLSCDVSNAAGLAANQTALLLDRFYDTNSLVFTTNYSQVFDLWLTSRTNTITLYDTNTLAFTTNYFQVFDLWLTNGLNTITLYATDLAGNTVTTSFTYLLTNDMTAPVITPGWPQDGQKVCGDTFTVDGWLDDPSALVQVSLVDSSGATNTSAGLVERDGRFWVENLPLAPGTNTLALTATDTWGNSATTNLTLYKSDLALGFSPIDPGQLFQPTISLTGTVSDTSCTIWVNGISARNNGDGTWQADGVPVTQGGTASFVATAYPAGHDLEASAANPAKTNVDQRDRLYVQQDIVLGVYSHEEDSTSPLGGGSTFQLTGYSHCWTDGKGGRGGGSSQYFFESPVETFTAQASISFGWPASSWPNFLPGTETPSGDSYEFLWLAPILYDTAAAPVIGGEFCAVSDPWDLYQSGFANGGYWEGTTRETYTRVAWTKLMLFTGGKAIPGRKSVFRISGWANELLDKRAYPPYLYMQDGVILAPFSYRHLPSQSVIFGDVGTLGSDGLKYFALPDGITKDVTPWIMGKEFYWYGVTHQKYTPVIQANNNLLDADRVMATNCVGQKVVFQLGFDPALPPGVVVMDHNQWVLPQKYVNARKWFYGDLSSGVGNYYITTCDPTATVLDSGAYEIYPPYCTNYLQENWPLNQPETGVWWISGGDKLVSCYPTLTFSDGRKASLIVRGQLHLFRPRVDFNPGDHGTPTCSLGGELKLNDMHFSATVTSEDFDGDVNWVQLINRNVAGDYPGYISIGTFGGYWLDNDPFYNTVNGDLGTAPVPTQVGPSAPAPVLPFGTDGFGDDPGIQCMGGYSTIPTSITDAFKTYLVFKPNGNGIWVTLGLVNWSWYGEAYYYGSSGWWLTDQSGPAPSYSDTDQPPVWSRVLHNSGN